MTRTILASVGRAEMLSRNLEQTLDRALALATERQHEYATIEHLLLALTEDQDAVPVLKACGVDLRQLQQELANFLQSLRASAGTDPKPTAGFQRVVQRSVIHVQSSGREEVTGANVLVALFSERESHAVYFLNLQDITRLDLINYIAHGVSKKRDISPPTVLQADYEYFSCFISYSHADKGFCRKLYSKMRTYGIACWMDDHELLPGDDLFEQIEKGIRNWDKAILVCSEHSLTSMWVEWEIDKALQKEQKVSKDRGEKTLAIIPLNLDGYLFRWGSGKASVLKARMAADFIGWKRNPRKFDAQVDRIAKALRADQAPRENPRFEPMRR